MHATTVAIDLAKEVFELAFADAQGQVIERKRVSRKAFAPHAGTASGAARADGGLRQCALLGPPVPGLKQQLEEFARRDVAVQRYRTVPGVGLLTATALRASAGDPVAVPQRPAVVGVVGADPARALLGPRSDAYVG